MLETEIQNSQAFYLKLLQSQFTRNWYLQRSSEIPNSPIDYWNCRKVLCSKSNANDFFKIQIYLTKDTCSFSSSIYSGCLDDQLNLRHFCVCHSDWIYLSEKQKFGYILEYLIQLHICQIYRKIGPKLVQSCHHSVVLMSGITTTYISSRQK